jgi:hypothetical protein
VVQRELQIIATDLHATAVRVTGDDPQRLARAGEYALAAGLELWFSPVPVNLEPDALPGYFARCAPEAERLRRAHEGRVVLVAGCEISLWCAGFMPGGDTAAGRIAAVTDPDLQRKPDVMAALASGLERAGHALRDIARAARETFAGPVTYASAPWETVEWELFDLVSVDAYRDADNAAGYRDALRTYRRTGKPVAVTEFGCCTYRGAADRGGTGWMITDETSNPTRPSSPAPTSATRTNRSGTCTTCSRSTKPKTSWPRHCHDTSNVRPITSLPIATLYVRRIINDIFFDIMSV